MNKDFTRYEGWMSNAPFAERQRQQANQGYAGCSMNQAGRLTEDECFILNHISHFGSEGYPVKRVGSRHWSWEYRGNGCPVVFPTKKQAIVSFESHLEILRLKLAGAL